MKKRITTTLFKWLVPIALLCGLNPGSAAIEQGGGRIRALHVVAKNVEVTDMKRIINQAQAYRLNMLVLGLYNAVSFKSMPLSKEQVPIWSVDEFLDVVAYARSKGLEVVPELKLLSHQEHFLGKYKPHLLYNATTSDPRKPEVYDITYRVLEELISLIQPRAIHIGHDEVSGFNAYTAKTRIGSGRVMLPAELFLKDVQNIHGFLKAKNIETWMWGDMLISPEEFPSMFYRPLHGAIKGYGKAMRAKLPRDIVICDWHYSDDQSEFQSLKVMREEGFRVIGSTWKEEKTTRNFSNYAALHGANGMIATTWFHVQKKDWDVVHNIIKVSGEAFLKYFPDAK